MSLPDYEDYYSYDYQTGQYSEDSYTTTLGYYDYQGYTDNPFKIGLDNQDKSAFTEHVTEKEETLDFFPVLIMCFMVTSVGLMVKLER